MRMLRGVRALTVVALVVGQHAQEARAANACNVEVKAGPLWNSADANTRCPTTCGGQSFAAWDGAWWTSLPGQKSVCQCRDKVTVLEAGPIWGDTDAKTKCPATCQQEGFAAWTGGWWTTVWGEMSVCQCKNKVTVVEAGPVWSDKDAAIKCPTTCSANNGFWTGAWWTTVPDKMSVCQCGSLCT
ncbi:mannan-binding protein [Archangium sp.]|uniref:mannan-binding protein n=1 Tax=Archangium sp. TaxID=1872627 RepID=UPI003899D554